MKNSYFNRIIRTRISLIIGIAALAVNGLVSIPRGYGFVFDNKEPDLFVEAEISIVSLYPGGLFVYPWIRRDAEGVPVFGHPQKVHLPKDIKRPNGAIFQTPDKKIQGWWLQGTQIIRTVFNKQELRFVVSSKKRCKKDLKLYKL